MIINSQTYPIGTSNGDYPAGDSLTDSLIGMGEIASIGYETQCYFTGFTKTGNYVNFGSVFTTSNGTNVTINFKHPIEINKNDV